jgi:hypothetical protein
VVCRANSVQPVLNLPLQPAVPCAGAENYLTKPFELRDLRSVLDESRHRLNYDIESRALRERLRTEHDPEEGGHKGKDQAGDVVANGVVSTWAKAESIAAEASRTLAAVGVLIPGIMGLQSCT